MVAGARPVAARVHGRWMPGTSGGAWQVDQGYQFVGQVAIVLALRVTRCAVSCGVRVSGAGGSCRGAARGFELFGGGPVQLAAVPLVP